jgi:hypothetical protein
MVVRGPVFTGAANALLLTSSGPDPPAAIGDGGSGPCPQNGEQSELSFTSRLSMLDKSHYCAIRAAKRASSASCAETEHRRSGITLSVLSCDMGVPSPPLPISAEPAEKVHFADALPPGAPIRPPSPFSQRGSPGSLANGLLVQGRLRKRVSPQAGRNPRSRPGTAIAPDEFGERRPCVGLDAS